MRNAWILPVFLAVLGCLSVLILRSVAPSLVSRQVIFLLLGGGLFWLASRVAFHQWMLLSPILYSGVVASLVFVKLLGVVTRGAASWIPIGSFHVQPSQLAVFAIALALTRYLTQHKEISWKVLGIALGIAGVPLALILIEPDFGTTVITAAAVASIIWISPVKLSKLGWILMAVGAFSVVSWLFLFKPYQKKRITDFFAGSSTSQVEVNYHARQSMIAVGSGQIWGRGLGQGVQSQLRFLPEKQTDFVFAAFAEEMGMLGAGLLLTLYLVLVGYHAWVFWHARAPGPRYYVAASGAMILTQVGINLGMNMGITPITGITLPFLSYGGSSILSLGLQLGVVYHLARHLPLKSSLYLR